MIQVNKVRDKIYQIRIIDRDEKSFHATLFPVEDGVSYASYLILDEKVTLIDTFELKYFDEIKIELEKLLEGRSIDYLILNHVEPDHSESFKRIYDWFPQIQSFCSPKAKGELMLNFLFDYDFQPVKTGDTLNIGEYDLEFFETAMVHWPDNMWTYLEKEKILFSNDGFGQLICDDVVYDTELPKEKVLAYAREYYTNIIFPNNMAVPSVLDRFVAMNWEIDTIAVGHGIMLRSYIEDIYELYYDLSHEKKDHKAVIVYETIWGNTRDEAYTIKEVLNNNGIECNVYRLSESRISQVIDDVATSSYLFIGTGNQNSCMIPIVADFVERLKSLKAKKTKVMVFGAYGWNKLPFDEVIRRLEDAKYTVSHEPILTNFKKDSHNIEAAETLIKKFMDELI